MYYLNNNFEIHAICQLLQPGFTVTKRHARWVKFAAINILLQIEIINTILNLFFALTNYVKPIILLMKHY